MFCFFETNKLQKKLVSDDNEVILIENLPGFLMAMLWPITSLAYYLVGLSTFLRDMLVMPSWFTVLDDSYV